MRCEVYAEQNSEAYLCSKKHVFFNCVCVLRGTALCLESICQKGLHFSNVPVFKLLLRQKLGRGAVEG